MGALTNDALVGLLRAATVEVRGPHGNGSGVAWGGGRVLTCNHVMQDDRATVTFADGAESPAVVTRRDEDWDAAVLSLGSPTTLVPLPVRESPLRAGEVLFAMGHPWGEPRALSSGVLFAAPGEGPVTVDLRVAPGNSGGPLVDAEGRLVGVISMYRGGAAVAVPITAFERLLRGAGQTAAA
jgi:serine protease Do